MSLSKQQNGSVLIEGLVAILIFSVGILAVVGLLTISTKSAGDAKYRLDASQLANQLVGQMLGSINRSTTSAQQLSALNSNFSSPNGVAYMVWRDSNVTPALPGASAAPPTVIITTTASTSATTPSNQAVITINWQAPNEPTAHIYTTIAQIR
jgi:type IV pilus assembly protein PilV